MTLLERLQARIRADGPLSVADYMEICLLDPESGYYSTREVFGAAGDFVTAPDISQMFGETLAVAVMDGWLRMGQPDAWHLVECGPGRGVLMADLLRCLAQWSASRPALLRGLSVRMVEASTRLREQQRERLQSTGVMVLWEDQLTLAETPTVIVGNEFLDALPIHQYVRLEQGWAERRVGLGPGGLAFCDAPLLGPLPFPEHDVPEGTVAEWCPAAHRLMERLGAHSARHPLVSLWMDYGHGQHGWGDSFQALRQHRPIDPLAQPGEADLTAHVDFGRLADSARKAGAACFGPVGQGAWLEALGIGLRLSRLTAQHPDRADLLTGQVQRLTAPDQMGTLFQALCVQSPTLPSPAGFHV